MVKKARLAALAVAIIAGFVATASLYQYYDYRCDTSESITGLSSISTPEPMVSPIFIRPKARVMPGQPGISVHLPQNNMPDLKPSFGPNTHDAGNAHLSGSISSEWPDSPNTEPGNLDFTPEMRLVDEGNTFRVVARISGMDRSQLDIKINENDVTLAGTRRIEHQGSDMGSGSSHRWMKFDSFSRRLRFPEPVDPGSMATDFQQGLLILTIQKQQP